MNDDIKRFAKAALHAGLHPLPCKADKKPGITRSNTDDRKPTEAEIDGWGWRHVGLICGQLDNPVLCIDFDQEGKFFPAYEARVRTERPELWKRLVLESSPSGGSHLWLQTLRPFRSMYLAHEVIEVKGPGEYDFLGKLVEACQNPKKSFKAIKYYGKWVIKPVAIETRGATKGMGDYALCSPSPGYELIRGDLVAPPLVDDADVEFLLSLAREFEQFNPELKPTKWEKKHPAGGTRPGDFYNAQEDITGQTLELLIEQGWTEYRRDQEGRIHLARPGKSNCTSATLRTNGVFYCFTQNGDPFEKEMPYSPFSVYTLLEHDGDFTAAAKTLAKEGFGGMGAEMAFADIEVPEDTASLVPVEYVIDGFLATGCTYIGGAHGIGKSSLLVPMTAMITGEIPSTLGLTVTLVRTVIYLAEDIDQIRRARFALVKHHGLVENGQFLLRQAERRVPEAIGPLIAEIVGGYTVDGPCGYLVKPLIVFDTTNANFEIENENDSQAVGRVISAIKTNSKGAPVWLIGHVAKNLVRAEFEALSGRGSGAWEADSQQTAFIFADNNAPENARFFGTKKVRFEPQFREIQIQTSTDQETIETPWGQTQTIVLRHGLPTRGSKVEREKARERVREERRQEMFRRKREEAEATILGLVEDIPEPIAKTKLVEQAKGRGLGRDFARAVLSNLIDRGLIDATCEVRAGAVTKYDGLRLADPSW